MKRKLFVDKYGNGWAVFAKDARFHRVGPNPLTSERAAECVRRVIQRLRLSVSNPVNWQYNLRIVRDLKLQAWAENRIEGEF